MNILHRYNSKERQHYLLGSSYSFQLRPQLMYVGTLQKQAGWCDEAHSHEYAELILVTDGCGYVRAMGQERTVKAGDLLVYNAGVVHEEASSTEAPMEMIFFALDKVNITDLESNHLLPPGYDFIVQTGDMFESFLYHANIMVQEMEQRDRFYHEIAQNVSRTFIMYLFRLLNRDTKENLLQGNDTCRLAVQYINDHYLEDITLDDIAAACFVNKFYLSHLFLRQQEVSVGQFVIKRRLEEAIHLLHDSNSPVSRVCELSGFNDLSYFCRCFKKHTGMTPSQYRKSLQK